MFRRPTAPRPAAPRVKPLAIAVLAAAVAIPVAARPLHGQEPAATLSALHDIVAAVSVSRVEADIRRLAAFGTRHTLSDTLSDTRGIGAARRWIKAEFDAISEVCGGCLEVSYQTSLVMGAARIPDTTAIVNVLAIQRGTTDPGRYVVMSGDIDSRATGALDGVIDAPGANDNASGMAGVLEAARVLTQYEFNGSIIYAGLSGEEQGLFGGRHMAQVALDEGWRLEAVLNNDMIGNIQGQNGVSDNTIARIFAEGTRADETEQVAARRRVTGGEVDSPSRNLARFVDRLVDGYVPNLDMMMVYRFDRFGRGGHHRPFNDVGFPAVRIMEANEDYRRQHQDIRVEDGVEYGDVIEEVEFDFAAKLTAVNAISLAAMAWAPAPPRNVAIQGAVRPSTTLRWDPVPPEHAPNLAGYRVYWRLTDAPQWQWSVFAGDVTEHTLENIVIDNYLFGVASVSEDGYESPVVFPWPIGAYEPLEWIARDPGNR